MKKIYIFLGFLIFFEFSSRIWLSFLASPDQYRAYVLYPNIAPADYKWSPHHYLSYYPTPGYRKELTSHNSLGYRDKEFSVTKPEGRYRIVAIGESTTYDTSVKDNNKTFTAQLDKILKEKYGYSNVEVINAGIGGHNSWEILINFEFRVLDINPDLIIVYAGNNDVHARLVNPEYYSGDNSGRRKYWSRPPIAIWERSCFLRILMRRFGPWRQVGLEAFVCAPHVLWDEKSDNKQLEALKKNPPVYFRRNMENIIVIAKARDIKIMLATWAYSPYVKNSFPRPAYVEGYKEHNDILREIAGKHNVPLFDFGSAMPQDSGYWADFLHSNEKGSEKKALLFAEFIHNNGLIDR